MVYKYFFNILIEEKLKSGMDFNLMFINSLAYFNTDMITYLKTLIRNMFLSKLTAYVRFLKISDSHENKHIICISQA